MSSTEGMRRLMRGEDGRDTRLIEAVPEISTGPSTQSPALSLTSAGTYIEAPMDEWQNTPIAMPPMTDEDGEEYARQEALDGHYETDDR